MKEVNINVVIQTPPYERFSVRVASTFRPNTPPWLGRVPTDTYVSSYNEPQRCGGSLRSRP